MRSAVEPTFEIGGVDGVPDGVCGGQDRFREMQRQVVLAEHGQHVDPFDIGCAEHLDDFTFGVGVAGFPFAEFDDDFVADASGSADIARFGDVDIVWDTGVIGDDVEELTAALERAYDLGSATFENADDGAGAGFVGGGSEACGANVASDEHTILVERGAGGAFGDGDFFELAVVGLKEALALTIHPDAAWDEVGFARLDVAIPLEACDVAGLFEGTEGPLEILLAWGEEA